MINERPAGKHRLRDSDETTELPAVTPPAQQWPYNQPPQQPGWWWDILRLPNRLRPRGGGHRADG